LFRRGHQGSSFRSKGSPVESTAITGQSRVMVA
jgi:hypothetical protein